MIEDLTGAYLKSVDHALPGFVDKLYVVGSAALGAWQPGVSDVDTVIFTSRVPTDADLAALRDVHAALRAKPYLDGVYVTPADEWPDDRRVAPFVVNGEFHTDITSKSGAGKYAASLFPAYASLAERAIRWRAGEPETFTAADLRASAELTDAVANDAWHRWG